MSIKKQTGYFNSYDDTRIYYEVRGEGPPLLFAYGIGCLMNHWRLQTTHFAKLGYQTIIFDYRSHHKSDIPENPAHISVEALARDVHSLMDHLGLKMVTLLGHSFGAPVIIRAFDIDPKRFSGLVFINGFATNPIKGMFGTDFSEKTYQFLNYAYHAMPETITYLWKQAIDNPLAIRASALAGGFNLNLTHLKDVEIYARGIASVDLPSFLTLFEDMMNYDGVSLLENIKVKSLIIGGSQDTVTPPKFQEELHKYLKNSDLLIVPYGSHCTMLDMPEYVNLKIEVFLRSLDT